MTDNGNKDAPDWVVGIDFGTTGSAKFHSLAGTTFQD